MLKKIKGSALLSALFIMTLVAIAVTAISQRLQQDIYRTHLSLNADKLYLASQFINYWGLYELTHENTPFVALDEHAKILSLPLKFKTIYPELNLDASIYDLQAKFNLNNLVDKKYFPLFLNLLKKIKLNRNEAKTLTLSLFNWLIPYQPSETVNASMNYYLSQQPPYWPAKQLMRSLSEFRLIKGVSPEIYISLTPEITVLPETTLININSISKPLLMAMTHNAHEDTIDKLLEERTSKGTLSRKKIISLLKKLEIKEDEITLSSQYFLVAGLVSGSDLSLRVSTLVKRSMDKEGKMIASIVATSLNSEL